jgi:cytochrome c oxidase subunit 1
MTLFSRDHKVIGLQYSITSMVFLLLGFGLMMVMRWQLAYPMQPVPIVGTLLGAHNAPGGIISPEFYNQLAAMHGTIMIFLGVVPLAVGAFGNYLVPLQIGAQEMAFPRLNMWSFWTYAAAGAVMVVSFFVPGGAANNGWTSYPPLSVLSPTTGQTMWLVGMLLLITSSLFASINTIVTIIQLRAPGLTFMRLPFFVWAQLVTAFLLLLAFPPLGSASLMQLMDRVLGSSFFLPTGLVVANEPIDVSGGGNPLLWQHLFWFLAHPEVYVLILPALGIVAEVITANIRKPLWGYRLMVHAAVFLGFMSMLVWAHHMFLTGMGTTMSAFFQTTTMIVSIPSVVILSALFVSLYGGSIRFSTPALFAFAFLPMFGLGGLTGLPLGLAATDIPLHDTYYVIGHFHYIVAPGTIFALFAGVYHWFPKVTGRLLHEGLGKIHFWGSLLCMNVVFFPMFMQGLAGLNRRLYDGGISYSHGQALQHWNVVQGWAVWSLAIVQVFFLVNLVISWRRGRLAGSNPWEATTLEWQTTSPPAADNFAAVPTVVRGPYEYSVPGQALDFSPQSVAVARAGSGVAAHATDTIPYTVDERPDTRTNNIGLGMWLFIASEVMLFGGLFSAYVLLRAGAASWGDNAPDIGHGLALSVILLLATGGLRPGTQRGLAASAIIGVAFLVAKAFGYAEMAGHGLVPATGTFDALYYLLTGMHALHVLGGSVAAGYLALRGERSTRGDRSWFAWRVRALRLYWYFVDLVWLFIFAAFYLF